MKQVIIYNYLSDMNTTWRPFLKLQITSQIQLHTENKKDVVYD